MQTLAEMSIAGIEVFTGGDHIWSKIDPVEDELQNKYRIALPANDTRTSASLRWQKIKIADQEVFVLNLLGTVFMTNEYTDNPFQKFDELYEEMGKPKLLVVDIHAEATSEKVALGHYLAGRASLVYGTHTHIPTADQRILDEHTGYITDLGMTGSNKDVLGVDRHIIIDRFLEKEKSAFEYPEHGPAWMNAIYCELDITTGKCVKLTRLNAKSLIN